MPGTATITKAISVYSQHQLGPSRIMLLRATAAALRTCAGLSKSFNSAKPMKRKAVLMDHVLMCDGRIPLEVLNDWA
jgi:hypothetical protein